MKLYRHARVGGVAITLLSQQRALRLSRHIGKLTRTSGVPVQLRTTEPASRFYVVLLDTFSLQVHLAEFETPSSVALLSGLA